jgi:hypothetical protein
MMPLRLFAAAAIAGVLCVGAPCGAAEFLDSAFTRFDAKQCRHTPGSDEEDYGSWRCKGFGGVAVRLAAGDQRMTVSFGRMRPTSPPPMSPSGP